MQLFHYHLVTSKVRLLEARYLGKLGFGLLGRYGWKGEASEWFEAGTSWEELDSMGFRLRLVELARGAVNVVLQPGHWEHPRVDHIGIALDDDGFTEALERAADLGLKIQDHPGKRTFIATEAGYRLEVHPPRDWIEDLLGNVDELRLGELHLRAQDPEEKAVALSEILGVDRVDTDVLVGDTLVRFEPGGPEGRPSSSPRSCCDGWSSYERSRRLARPRPRRSSSGCGRPSSRRGRTAGRAARRLRRPLRARRRAAARGHRPTASARSSSSRGERAGCATPAPTSPRTASTTC